MLFRFPDQQTLVLAVTTGAVPEKISATTATATIDAGRIEVSARGRLSRKAQSDLGDLGVEVTTGAPQLPLAVASWLQLLPVEPAALRVGPRDAVLLDVPDGRQLPELVGEMLRLGNDRISYRHLASGEQTQTRCLLRVLGPPYYTLLRALEDGSPDKPVAYLEQSPRVWVQAGFRHPMAEKIQPAAGQTLFIRAPRAWHWLGEQSYQDIYQVLDFHLPKQPTAWQERKLGSRIQVPLRLEKGSSNEPAELWVLRNNAAEQLDDLVSGANNRLLQQLSFAVAEMADGQPLIVVRARPTKAGPPVLALNDAVEMRSYLKIANLFVPCQHRLHPPLRRDAVAELLVPDTNRVTWLQPQDDDSFTPESLPDSAFEPLYKWVDYVLDHQQAALDGWIQSQHFDFESFVCEDDQAQRPRPKSESTAPKKKAKDDDDTASDRRRKSASKTSHSDDDDLTNQWQISSDSTEKPQPSQLEQQLRELEEQFRVSEEAHDSPQRDGLWRQMAQLNELLHRRRDTTLCWSNSLWERDDSPQAVDRWYASEQRLSSQTVDGDLLDRLGNSESSMPAEASLVCAYLVQAAGADEPPAELPPRLGKVARFLERQESFLPIRTSWLAWLAVTQLTQGDVLALARARDRILGRLHEQGMRPEYDLPSFMRTDNIADTDRYHVIRQDLPKMREMVQRWIAEPQHQDRARTSCYADLIFAYGMARIGDPSACRSLLQAARQGLISLKDPLHQWLYDAFSSRIETALQGQPATHALPAPIQAGLEALNRLESLNQNEGKAVRYMADRVRRDSKILEPTEKVDAFANFTPSEEVAEFQRMAAIEDPDQLRIELEKYLAKGGAKSTKPNAKFLAWETALNLTPRVGETFSLQLLGKALRLVEEADSLIHKAMLLEHGIYVAGHYGHVQYFHAFFQQLEGLLPNLVALYLKPSPNSRDDEMHRGREILDGLFARSFRGLRKMGMHDQMGTLFSELASLVDQHLKSTSRRKRNSSGDSLEGRPHHLLLYVASGWFFFGQHDLARNIIEKVQTVLFSGQLEERVHQNRLARHYASAFSQCPVDIALPYLHELFELGSRGKQKLPFIADEFMTKTHLSASQFNLVEDAVCALVGDDFTLNSESRRWLDEDEFLIRRRIHRDVHQAVETGAQ